MRRLITFLGICALASANLNTIATPPDARAEKLQAFFRSYGCPEPFHVQDYLSAADAYALDYRLLPALSVRESTCGWYAHGNNHWGWNSARTDFKSVTHGIEYITWKLAQGTRYQGKSLKQKLHTYNPVPGYARQVQKIMRQVEPLPTRGWRAGDAKLPASESRPESATPGPRD